MKTIPDFDALVRLAKDEPEKLEELRRECIESLLSSTSAASQSRLRGMDFVIDAKRRAAKTPEDACMVISQMLLEQVRVLQVNYDNIRSYVLEGGALGKLEPVLTVDPEKSQGAVVEFDATIVSKRIPSIDP